MGDMGKLIPEYHVDPCTWDVELGYMYTQEDALTIS